MKAIIVIEETPVNCSECEFRRYHGSMTEAYCCLDSYHSVYLTDQGRPSWCPLKPMPEKWEAQINGLSPEQQIANWNFSEGWNACLRRIEK